MTPLLIHVGKTVALFVALNAAYWFLFRSRHGKGALSTILPRVRGASYVVVLSVTARYLVRAWPYEQRALATQVIGAVLTVAGTVVVVELTAALVFGVLLPARRNLRIPYLIQSLARAAAYLFVGLTLLSAWGKDVSSLLTGSAILSVVVGLALQETLGNLFAGLSVDVSRPFRLGDWVRIGAQEGRVEALDWRATSLVTREGARVTVPNRDVAKEPVFNYSWPSAAQRVTVPARVHYRHAPGDVEAAMLACAADVPGVCREPAAEVQLSAYTADSVEYALKVWIDDWTRRPGIESELRRRIWYRFHRQGLDMPYAIGDMAYARDERGNPTLADRLALLGRIGFFEGLAEPELARLAETVALVSFARGEVIFRQGDPGHALFVIRKGEVEVRGAGPSGEEVFRRPLRPGDFFGEISLMTGAARSATVAALTDVELLEVEKEDLRPLLESNPQLAATISRALAERQQASALSLAEHEASRPAASPADIESAASQILAAVKRFFFS